MPTKTYMTIQGDCWDTIAYRLWGDEYGLDLLRRANPEYMDMVVFPGGVTLNVPERPEPAAKKTEMPPWRTL